MEQKPFLSIRVRKPDDQGGPTARQGFSYQDDVAVGFVLEMIESEALIEVRCETQHDVVLVWAEEELEIVEYVQVKSGNTDKLWSVADICARKSKDAAGTSLFERSLSRDCCKEESRFRIVTRIPVVPELTVMTYGIGTPGREASIAELKAIADQLQERYPDIASPKGNRAEFWAVRCLWCVMHDARSLENANLIRIEKIAAVCGVVLFPEQTRMLLLELRAKVKDASEAPWDPHPELIALKRDDVLGWWKHRITTLEPGLPAGRNLKEKMADANLPYEQIALAGELRRDYTIEVRAQRYMKKDDLMQFRRA